MHEPVVKIVPLVCPKCGADLEVPDEISVFRCTYCGSKVQLIESSNVRGLKLIEEGVRQILEHSQTTASGVSTLLKVREAEREAWEAECLRLESELRHLLRQARVYTLLCLLFVFVIGPGLTVLFATTMVEQMRGRVMWPVLGGLVVGFSLGFKQVGLRTEALLVKQKLERWLDRRPLA